MGWSGLRQRSTQIAAPITSNVTTATETVRPLAAGAERLGRNAGDGTGGPIVLLSTRAGTGVWMAGRADGKTATTGTAGCGCGTKAGGTGAGGASASWRSNAAAGRLA